MSVEPNGLGDSQTETISLNRQLVEWLLVCDLRRIRNLDELFSAIALQIAEIDRQLVAVVRQVLGSQKFRQLESSYRSIYKLIATSGSSDNSIRNMPSSRKVNVFVLDISAEELESDLNANSHRQTWVYDKLFRKRFDYLIGEQNIKLENYSAVYPFSLMIVDFDFGLNQTKLESFSEKSMQLGLDSIRKLARVGEECFCMFLISLAPNFFGESINSFSQLENVIDVKSILRQPRYSQWNEFRQQECSRMVGLSMPRVLVRTPYRNYQMRATVDSEGKTSPATGIVFNEHEGYGKTEQFLWGSICICSGSTYHSQF